MIVISQKAICFYGKLYHQLVIKSTLFRQKFKNTVLIECSKMGLPSILYKLRKAY